MPIPQMQPDSVKAVIGQQGENLKGSLITKDQFGVSVKVEQTFYVGSTEATADTKEVQAAVKQARELLQALKELEQQGRSMESLRNTDDLSKVRQCGDLMRERQSKAKELLDRAETLPKSYGLHLSIAARELSMCVTCSGGAIQNCNTAQSTLNNAEKAINQAM